MEYEVELMLKVADMSFYHGIRSNLTSLIKLQDEVDKRFNEDFFDLLSATLLYHQIIEILLESLVSINEFNSQLNLFPQKVNQNHFRRRSFYQLIQQVKKCYEFERKNEFIVLAEEFNQKRNRIVHRTLKEDVIKEKSINELKNIKNMYHCIQKIYQDTATSFFDYVDANFTNTSMYLKPDKDYSRDLDFLSNDNIRDKYSQEAIEVVKNQIYEYQFRGNHKVSFRAGLLNSLRPEIE